MSFGGFFDNTNFVEKIMKNITYLFGAGASYNSLPLMNNLLNDLKFFKSYFIKKTTKEKEDYSIFNNSLQKLIEKIESKKCSIDSLAVKLLNNSMSDSKELMHLKSILTGFFIFSQIEKDENFCKGLDFSELDFDTKSIISRLKTPIDRRYIDFVNVILRKNKTFADNIKFLSWNYDSQLELAYSTVKDCNIEDSIKQLQVLPPKYMHDFDINKSCLLKLNGTAGLYFHKNKQLKNLYDYSLDIFSVETENEIVKLLKYNYDREFFPNCLYFAYESEEIVINTRACAKKIIENTDTLIIIGYSFPMLNYVVDFEIFNSVKNIKNVFIQVSEDDFECVRHRLSIINPKLSDKIEPIKCLEDFFIIP